MNLIIIFLSSFIGWAMVVYGLIDFFIGDTTFKGIVTLGIGCIILLLSEIKDNIEYLRIN